MIAAFHRISGNVDFPEIRYGNMHCSVYPQFIFQSYNNNKTV